MNGDHEVNEGAGLGALMLVHRRMRAVECDGNLVSNCARRLRNGFHCHQHPPHIGVMNDRHRRAARVAQILALDALLCIGKCLLISALGNTDTLQPNHEASFVHHDEHILKAAVGLTNQVCDGSFTVAVRKDGGWARMNAKLVFDRNAAHIVAGTEGTIVIDQELRHQKQ